MDTKFGNLLHTFRTDRHLSQKVVAEKASLHDSYISLLELNKRGSPSRRVVYDLANAMDLPDRERNMLLLAAGFTPDNLKTLLFEPLLADLDDVLSNVPRGNYDEFVGTLSSLIKLGQDLIPVGQRDDGD